MKTSININHPLTTLLCGDGDYVYKLCSHSINNKNTQLWCKTESNLHKTYSTTVFGDYDISNLILNENDYVIKYNTVENHLKYTENFNSQYSENDSWIFKNINTSSLSTLNIPFLTNPVQRFSSSVIGNQDCYLEQGITTNTTDVLKLSVFVTYFNKTTNNPYISLGMIGDNNYGYFVKTNFISTNNYKLDKNYNDLSNTLTNNECVLSKLESPIYKTDEYTVYKLTIVCRFNQTQQTKCRLNLLTEYGKFKFEDSNDRRTYYISGFQLEKYNLPSEYYSNVKDFCNMVLELEKPYIYNNTNTIMKTNYLDCISNAQIIDGNITLVDTNNSLYNVLNANKKYIKDIGYILEDIKPNIKNPMEGDILVISNILKSKTDDDKLAPIKFGGSCDKDNDPLYSIFYDKLEKVYKIKVYEEQDSVDDIKKVTYENLTPNNFTNTNKQIVHALIYNQGYFETWSSQGKCSYKHGYNTGGGHNFWKNNH